MSGSHERAATARASSGRRRSEEDELGDGESDQMKGAEDLLKKLLKEFKSWYDSGSDRPPDSLVNARNEFMRRILEMEKDHRALEKLREDNPDVTWSYAHGTLFKGYAPPHIQSSISSSSTSRDPAGAILGEGDAGAAQ